MHLILMRNQINVLLQLLDRRRNLTQSRGLQLEAKKQIPIDQAQLLTTLSSIDNIRICNDVTNNCSVGYSVNQEESGIFSCEEMIVNGIINSSDRREGSQSVSEPILLDVIKVAEEPTIMLQGDCILSNMSTITSTSAAAAPSTSTSAPAATTTTTTTAAAAAAARVIAPAPTSFEPCKAVPAAASQNASDIVIEAREEHSIGSRRNTATREAPRTIQLDISYNECKEPRHAAVSTSTVISCDIDTVSHESYSAGSTRQHSPPITRNQSPLKFGIFTHPDNVV
jgi:hypothetical protein